MEAVLKILLLTQWFDPEPTFKGLVFAQKLQAEGHEVEVITGFPNYPGGQIYAGYKQRWLQRESINGIRVNRVPLYPSHDGSGIKRAFNYISFAITSCLFGLFMAKKAQVIYAYHPPLTVGMSAVFIGFFRRIPVVYDIQDMWPDTLKATGMLNNKKALKLVSSICQWIYRRAAALVVLSPGFKQLLLERGVPAHKVSVIYNWCDASVLTQPQTTNKLPIPMENHFNVVFAGTMGKAQALDSVLQAAAIVQNTNTNVRFVFVGGGVEITHLKKLAQELLLDNIVFIPRMPMDEVGQVLASADVLLVHLRNDPLFEITVPSKTQAYMAVGKPILMAVSGDAANLVEQADCGLSVQAENETAIADAVLKLASMPHDVLFAMGQRGKSYYQDKLSLDVGVKKFINVFETVKKQ
ncbi:MAG: glycosyltransferase family 4 protein [Moraxellaceae bacterium]|nr:glycosyltransferase family 4 protein [Moraxellaceae bacterium]MCP5177543.1 glycosyltransferase family 4 protein [Moraxellaceae bacterium]